MRNSTLLLFLIGSFALSTSGHVLAATKWIKTPAKVKLTTCTSPATNSTAKVTVCKTKSTLSTADTEKDTVKPADADACPKVCKKTSWTGWWQINNTDPKNPEYGCECVAK